MSLLDFIECIKTGEDADPVGQEESESSSSTLPTTSVEADYDVMAKLQESFLPSPKRRKITNAERKKAENAGDAPPKTFSTSEVQTDESGESSHVQKIRQLGETISRMKPDDLPKPLVGKPVSLATRSENIIENVLRALKKMKADMGGIAEETIFRNIYELAARLSGIQVKTVLQIARKMKNKKILEGVGTENQEILKRIAKNLEKLQEFSGASGFNEQQVIKILKSMKLWKDDAVLYLENIEQARQSHYIAYFSSIKYKNYNILAILVEDRVLKAEIVENENIGDFLENNIPILANNAKNASKLPVLVVDFDVETPQKQLVEIINLPKNGDSMNPMKLIFRELIIHLKNKEDTEIEEAAKCWLNSIDKNSVDEYLKKVMENEEKVRMQDIGNDDDDI